MTDEQIELLRRAIQQEIVVESIDGFEHGAWGWAEKNAEVGFEEWFNGNYGKFSCRSEWFYGDCEVKDEKIRKDLVYNWVRSAYMSGYEMGKTSDVLEETK